MPSTIDFTLHFQKQAIDLRLYAEGAIFWPAGQTLFVTDPHFGKADSFRHAGIAVPTAVHDHDLAKLSKVLTESGAAILVVLGDFFHTRHSQSDSALHTLAAWRKEHTNLEIVLVEGNHDAHAGPPPEELNIYSVPPPFSAGPFICHHLPQAKASKEGYILAGHLHPYVVLMDRDRSRLRLASFIFSPHQAVLPAFGNFTGGSIYPPSAHDRVFVVSQGEIVEINTSRQRAPSSR
jgi:DNA ligase-associated metallophosphoesterase